MPSKDKSKDMGYYLLAIVISMVGITYASVPLYRIFCQATGFGGTVQIGKTVEEKIKTRYIIDVSLCESI